jgi:hypothetical protein
VAYRQATQLGVAQGDRLKLDLIDPKDKAQIAMTYQRLIMMEGLSAEAAIREAVRRRKELLKADELMRDGQPERIDFTKGAGQ